VWSFDGPGAIARRRDPIRRALSYESGEGTRERAGELPRSAYSRATPQGDDPMSAPEIRSTVVRLITGITRIPAEKIEDRTSFREELKIDSLSLIEIGVAVDYEYRLNLPEEEFQALDTLEQTVSLVERHLATQELGARNG
jgi:acyl carrier protein